VLVLFLLVHATVAATRAQLALEPLIAVRSTSRALFVYARLRIPAVGGLGLSSALLLGELGTVLSWRAQLSDRT
jgi:galactokinase/mevalonate kinase-like predicted kinase